MIYDLQTQKLKLLDEVLKIILYNFLTFLSDESLLRLKRALLHSSLLLCETCDYLVIKTLIPYKKPILIYKIKRLEEA
jgi:hypothetical protein